MIIDKVVAEGVPYRCKKCRTLYVWRPDEPDGRCSVSLYSKKMECSEINCSYYRENEYAQCPMCGSRDNYEISATKYKLLRAFRRLWDD